jgi:hypothetical protein
MPQRGRRNADQVLILALACGATVEAAAHQAGVSPATVYRRKNDPQFLRRLHEARADMVQRTAGMLAGAGMESVKTLLTLQKEPAPFAVRLGAARAVLELGVKLREIVAVEERLRALEEQLASHAGGQPWSGPRTAGHA